MTFHVTLEDILRANQRIGSIIHKTDIFTSSTVNQLTEREVFFKAENLHKTGSFKARGALNAVLALKERDPSCQGVVTRSSGNHGQGLAWAARLVSMPCVVIVFNNASSVKVNAIKGYGAEVVYCEPNITSRVEACDLIAKERGLTFISSHDNYDIIAGQGTVGLELFEQVPDLDAVLVPINGGGLCSGISLAALEMRPQTKIYAVEPKGKDLEKCLRAGDRLWANPPQSVHTIAEGIRSQQVGQLTWPILKELLEKDVFSVTDDEIVEAMKFTFQRMKVVIEPTSAVTVSAVLSDKMKNMDPSIKKIAVILSGGNVDIEKLPW